jgi:L-threonylcarbamoyladenylate synthase
MQTRVLKVDAAAPEPSVVAEAAAVIRAGGLVAFPTETVYGLGANALSADAVAGIFRAKGRPVHDPLIVHLADPAQLPTVVAGVPAVAGVLAEAFWPGPLTLVLPRGPRIPPAVTAGGPTVAVRVPSHPVARALIAAAGVPVAAPSANRFGRVSPTSAQHVLADLDGRIDVVLDGGRTTVGVESTVLSLAGDVPVILRPGGVSREALCAVLGEVAVRQEVVAEDETLVSPGTTLKHYAPRARVTLYRGDREAVLAVMQAAARRHAAAGERVGVLIAEEDAAAFDALPVVCEPVGSTQALAGVARRLYGALRALDAAGVTVILARDFGSEGLGLAIRDRLTRAAAGQVVRVGE